MQYEALLIDLDGVIRHWHPSDESIEIAHGLPIGSIRLTAFSPKLVWPALTGDVTDEEWRHRTAAELHRQFGAVRAAEAVAQWSVYTGNVDETTLSILNACSATLKIVLITNATSRLPQDLLALGLYDRFYGIVNSSQVGAAKPSEEIFRVALKRAAVTAEQALFIDDTAGHVEVAAGLGILGHVFCCHSEMASFLKQAGVLSVETS